MTRLATLLCLLLIALPRWAAAQNAHESYLTLDVEQVSVHAEWQVRLLDLDAALQLDANHDGEVTWEEIEPPAHGHRDLPAWASADPGERHAGRFQLRQAPLR